MPSWRQNSTGWRTLSLSRSRRFSKPLQHSKTVSRPAPDECRRRGHQGVQVVENTSCVRWDESRREKIREEERRYKKIGARANMKLQKRPARLFSNPDSTHSDNPRAYGVSSARVKKKVTERDISRPCRGAGELTAAGVPGHAVETETPEARRRGFQTAQADRSGVRPLSRRPVQRGWPGAGDEGQRQESTTVRLPARFARLARMPAVVVAGAATPPSAGGRTTPASASTEATALRTRTSLVHVQRATAHGAAVDGGDGGFRLVVIVHFHESEAARTAGIAIGHDADAPNTAVRFKQRAQFVFRRAERQIADKNTLQANVPQSVELFDGWAVRTKEEEAASAATQNHRRILPPGRLAFKRDHSLQKCQRKSKPPNGGRQDSSTGIPANGTGEAMNARGGGPRPLLPWKCNQAWPPGCEQPGKLGNITCPVQPNSRMPISDE